MNKEVKDVLDKFLLDLKEAAIHSGENPYDVWEQAVRGYMQGVIEMKASHSKVAARRYAVELLSDFLEQIDMVRH